MNEQIFYDPFMDHKASSEGRSADPSPVPKPQAPPHPSPQFIAPGGRDRETQQVIHDLAVLAAEQLPREERPPARQV